jgi:hypothetical protein
MTCTHQLYRPPGSRIFGALAGVMSCKSAVQIVGDSAIEGFIRTSNQIYYPFASGHISDPAKMVAHGLFHVFIELSSLQPFKVFRVPLCFPKGMRAIRMDKLLIRSISSVGVLKTILFKSCIDALE